MANDNDPAFETELHEKEGSLRRGWPAVLLTIGMVSAAVYAFSPRQYPEFPQTRVHAADMIAGDVARQGSQVIAVGELGHILTTTNPRKRWREADVQPQRSATLTRVRFVAEDVAIAVGHSGWIVRTEDGGRTWEEVRFDEDSSDPLLGIAGPYQGKLFAIGSFGQFLVSSDLGRTWASEELVLSRPGEGAEAKDSKADPDSEDYDPFAAFDSGQGVQALARRHLYDIVRGADGSLLLVGERGLVARSTDLGQTWTELDKIYDGSFYGALRLSGDRLLVYGMRGHAFITDDYGQTWQRCDMPTQQGLFGGTVTDDGQVVLVGGSNTMLASSDRGESFRRVTERGPHGLVSLIRLGKDAWLTAGEGGVHVKRVDQSVAPAGEAS